MKKVVVIVEFAENNLAAYVKDVDGIAVTGKDLKEIKASAKEAIALYVDTCKEMSIKIPDLLKGKYELVYKYDLCSFLNAYAPVFGKSALESLTGINQKQLWHYASGKNQQSQKLVL